LHDGGYATGYAQAGVHILKMLADRGWANSEPTSDLLVGAALGD